MVAGPANQVVQAGAFAAQDQDAVPGEIEAVVVGRTSLIESNDPDVLLLQFFECPDQVHNPRNPQVFRRARAGLQSHWAERGGAPLREDDTIDTGSIRNAEQRTEVLRIFYAVQCHKKARLRRIRSREQVLDRKKLLRLHKGDNALVCIGSGKLREMLTRLLPHSDAGVTAVGDQPGEPVIVALGGDQDMIEAAMSGPEGLCDRVHAVKNIHECSVDGGLQKPGQARLRATAMQLSIALAARRSRPCTVCEKKMPRR